MKYILKNKKDLILLSIIAIIDSLLTMLLPILIAYWIKIDVEFEKTHIFIVVSIIISALFLKLILVRFKETFACKSNTNESLDLMHDFYKMDYNNMQEKGPTYYIERILRTIETLYLLLGTTVIQLVTNIIVLVISLVITFTVNPIVGILMLALLPLNYLSYKMLNKNLQKKSKITQEAYGKSMQELIDLTSETDFIKQQSTHKQFLSLNKISFSRLYTAIRNINIYAGSMSAIINSINKLAEISMYLLIIFNIINSGENVLAVVLFSIMFPIYFGALNKVVNSNIALRDLNEAQSFIDSLSDMKESSGTKDINSIESLELDIAELKIGERVLSNNIKGAFKIGDIVSINGESGKGKSTLLKLIPKFRTSDTILLNGEDIKNFDNSKLRKLVYYMSQDVPIIMESIENNILLGNDNYKEKFDKVIKIPVIKNFLDIKGLSTMVTENGSNLSGGEKQKIALARALCSDMEVLILDEISSNIDKESSYEIYKAIAEVCSDKLIFIISHDKTHIEFCNKELNL